MGTQVKEWRPEPALGFDHMKSVQTVAYFVRKAGGSAEKLKLIKLVYLAERLSFERRGRPMNFDSFVSLPHGPVASSALNGIDHRLDDPVWDALALAENRKDVTIVGDISEDHLSRADIAILEAIWDAHGHRTASQIRNWTHKHCPEYVEVGPKGSLPISVTEILEHVGRAHGAVEAAREVRALQMEIGKLERMRAA
jgi:uncharacterized phage-associated protein